MSSVCDAMGRGFKSTAPHALREGEWGAFWVSTSGRDRRLRHVIDDPPLSLICALCSPSVP